MFSMKQFLSGFLVLGSLCMVQSNAVAQDFQSELIGKSYAAKDTLKLDEESRADAKLCLKDLRWKPGNFDVALTSPVKNTGELLVRFPTPNPTGNAVNDLVAMEWYLALDEGQKPIRAPAVIVVHESGSRMTAGRFIAKGLRRHGLHTFLIHLPYYGERRRGQKRPGGSELVTIIRQAVGDVRRARDAVSVLPFVDNSHIALQGTSLGGFVSSTVAGLDDGFDSVYLLLAGGNLYDIVQKGKKDAAKVRERLEQAGITDEQLKALLWIVEPTRLAHRVRPERTWLYSGILDSVVPLENARVLAKACTLEEVHHIRMTANHYTGVIYLPFVLKHIRKQIGLLQQKKTP